MLRIGDFARLGGVTVRALRHYDEEGLLAPARVDEATGSAPTSAAIGCLRAGSRRGRNSS